MSATTTLALFYVAFIGAMLHRDADAFSLLSTSRSASTSDRIVARLPFSVTNQRITTLSMAEEDAAEGGEEQDEASAEDNGEENEAGGPPEDPELTALKESIAELEAALADKKSKLQYELEQCEDYSKSGYARKVADMENMKRVRSNIASTSKASATASVLKEFLPIYDNLNQLKETYSEDEFGKKYSELNLEQTFATLGVTSFDVQQGDKINNFRMKVLESEYSNDCAKDTVLKMVSPGMELDGNVLRPASCVSSLGSEADAAAAAEEGGDDASAEEAASE